MLCFLELVKWFLFKICNNILKMLVCVFLILFNKIIEYGL